MHIGGRSLLGVSIGVLMLAPVPIVRGAEILGSTDTLDGHAVSSFVDWSGTQLNSIGFALSGSAVRDPGAQGTALFLSVPAQAAGTNFSTLELDWNPQGHPPPGVYDVPHFDFHFYYIPDSLRTTIPGGVLSSVPSQFLLAGYSQPGPTVPMMGGHSLDLTSPEFNGGHFSQTFIYGFYGGQEAFVEPMATQAYLEGLAGAGTSAQSFAIRQPNQYGLPVLPSLVPTTVQYSYNSADDRYAIAVGNFVSPVATPEPGTLALVIPPALLFLWRKRRADRRSAAV